MSTRPEISVNDGVARTGVSAVSWALLSGRAPSQAKAARSPLSNKALDFMAPASEYRTAFTPAGGDASIAPTRSTRRGNAHTADLWLPVGVDEYVTETAIAYPGHHPPPAAPRPVPKYEPSTLHLHAETVHRTSFTDPAAAAGTGALGRQAAHKPKERTAKIPLAFASATEYRERFRAAAAVDSATGAPAVKSASAPRSPSAASSTHAMGSPGKPLLGVSQYAEAFGSGATTSRGGYVPAAPPGAAGATESPALARMVSSGTATFGKGLGDRAHGSGSTPSRPGLSRPGGLMPAVSPIKGGTPQAALAAVVPSSPGRSAAHVPTGSLRRLGGGPAKMRSLTTNKDIDAPLADPWALMNMLYPSEGEGESESAGEGKA